MEDIETKETLPEKENSSKLIDESSVGEEIEKKQQETSDLLESTNDNMEEKMKTSHAEAVADNIGIDTDERSCIENVGTPLADEETDEPQGLDNPENAEQESSTVQKDASDLLQSMKEDAAPLTTENENLPPSLSEQIENAKEEEVKDDTPDENSRSSLLDSEISGAITDKNSILSDIIPTTVSVNEEMPVSPEKEELEENSPSSSVPGHEKSVDNSLVEEASRSSVKDNVTTEDIAKETSAVPENISEENLRSSVRDEFKADSVSVVEENSQSSVVTPVQDENSQSSVTKPDESSKSSLPQDENSKSSLPQDENSKSSLPQDENSKSSLPRDENSMPQEENSKSSLPQDENSMTLLPQDENSKSSFLQDENSKSSLPQNENSKFSVNSEEEKLLLSDKDENSQTSVIETSENKEAEVEKMETDEPEEIASPEESETKESPKTSEQVMEVDDIHEKDTESSEKGSESAEATSPVINEDTTETVAKRETDESKKDEDVEADKPFAENTSALGEEVTRAPAEEEESAKKSDLLQTTSEKMDTTEENDDGKIEESEKEKTEETKKEGTKDDDSDPDVSIIEKEEVKEVVNLIDDDEEDEVSLKKVVSKPEPIVKQSSNDMGLQIASVTSGATMPVDDKPAPSPAAPVKPKSSKPKQPQTCIVCGKVGRCKYNIKRNEEIKHLCDEPCFVKFKTNPTMYLKSSKQQQAEATQAAKPPPSAKPAEKTGTNGQQKSKQTVKTCHVCQLMNISTNKPFCNWHGLDFCDEGCLQKFQNSLNTSCSLCTEVIPSQNRGLYVFKISNTDIRTFCTQKCLTEFRKMIRLCTYCNKDLSNCPDSFSAPVGSQKTFQEFCSQACMTKYEKDMTAPDVEITTITPGTHSKLSQCAVCSKNTIPLHTVKLNNVVNKLCSAPCLQAFQYANKLTLNKCENCGKVCASEQTKSFFIQYEGNQKKFCSDRCVEIFRNANQKVVPCAWCGSKKRNFDMIERVDSNNKYQLFCTLNCLSLYRVNLQAKSNLCVCCDHCRKYTPAQYHLTMSDASVRNFCSYNCVMAFQKQFTSGSTSAITPNTSVKSNNKSTNRATSSSGKQGAAAANVPIISNVVSLAPPAGQKQQVNIRNTSQVPVVIGGQKGTTIQTTSTGTQPIQQQIIVQPPAPKVMKNKSLLCKPFVQTKATSCRPSTQNKKIGTDEEPPPKPVIIPVPVPIYVPTPLAMFSATTPQFYPVPIPIPVPIFIPTTKKSAGKILKQIKEIQNRIPADPLEAELLMMAEAVAGDKGSSDSDSDSEKGADDLPAFDEIETASPIVNKGKEGEEDMLQMALRVADEITEPIMDLEDNVQPVAVKTDPPPKPVRQYIPDDDDPIYSPPINTRQKRGSKRASRGRSSSTSRPKRQRTEEHEPHHHHHHQQQQQPVMLTQPVQVQPPEDANSYLKFTYGVNAWKHWVVFKNSQLEKVSKVGSGKLKLFKTDLLQCTADELNYSLCLFCKEVRKPNGEEYSPDSIYYLCLGIQQYLYENGRVDNIFSDLYYEKFSECLSEVLSHHQPKLNAAGQMLCRIEEEHLWEAKQLGAHSPYVLLNTLIYFHTKYFMMKTPQEHMNMSFTQILKHWRKGGPGKPTSGNTAGRSVTLRYYCMGPGGAAGKPKSKEGIPVYETSENLENPLRCPVKLYEFYLSKCPESIKNVNDMFYLVPERSCVPDSPVWYSTQSLALDVMTKMLNRILLVREIQEAHLHAQPIYV